MRCFTATDGESAWQILTSASVEMRTDLVSPFGMSQSHPSVLHACYHCGLESRSLTVRVQSIGRRWVSRPCAAVCTYVAAQVLLDIVLPDISGVELLQRIRDSDNEVDASPLHVPRGGCCLRLTPQPDCGGGRSNDGAWRRRSSKPRCVCSRLLRSRLS